MPVINDNGYRRDELRDIWKPGFTMTNMHSYCQEAHNLPFLEMPIINNANILKWLTYLNIRYPLQRRCHYMCICKNLDGWHKFHYHTERINTRQYLNEYFNFLFKNGFILNIWDLYPAGHLWSFVDDDFYTKKQW